MSDEFLVNTYAGQWQQNPDITRLTDGTVLVVWSSFYSEGDDDFYYIGAQRFTAEGAKIGGEMLLDDDINGQSTNPSVTALADGGFALAWESARGDSILDQTDVYTRAFNADMTARGASTVVHMKSAEDQYAASVSATPNGGYTLTWSSYEGSETDHWDDIFTRRFDADGAAIGRQKQVNQFTEMDQHNSRATTLSNGNVLLTWESEYAGNENPAYPSDAVRGRIYSAKGRALTDEFLVVGDNDGMNEGVGLTSSAVDVAALSGGRFVVSWYETVLHDDRDTTFEIHAQMYRKDGTAIGRDIVVRSSSEGVPDHSAVIGLDGGGFVVAWDAFGEETYEFDEVFARVYDDRGKPVTAAFKVNPPSGETVQEDPELVALDDGAFMIVYQSEYLDGDNDAIAGRIFERSDYLGAAAGEAVAGTAFGAIDPSAFGGDGRFEAAVAERPAFTNDVSVLHVALV